MQTRPFTSIVRATLSAKAIATLLKHHNAVILERVARAAGATNWFYCCNQAQLQVVESQLLPGSAVSFYFDDRIQAVQYSPQFKPAMEKIIAETRCVVVGLLGHDGLRLDVEYVESAGELAEVTANFDSTTLFFFGEFPGRDNDGVRAVSVVLPDEDGVVRPHPH